MRNPSLSVAVALAVSLVSPLGTSSAWAKKKPSPSPVAPVVVAPESEGSVSTKQAEGPESLKVTSLEYAGPGCPADSAAVSISPDGQVFTLIFDSFVAEVDRTSPNGAKKSKRHCIIKAAVAVPKGWSYSLSSVDYRGYARLDAGVTARQQSKYKMSGGTKEAGAETVLNGPFDADYNVRDDSFDAATWSKCGKGDVLHIRTDVEVKANNGAQGAGVMTVDSVDGAVVHRYTLSWQRC